MASLLPFGEEIFSRSEVNKNATVGVNAIGKHRVKNVGNSPFERKILLSYSEECAQIKNDLIKSFVDFNVIYNCFF